MIFGLTRCGKVVEFRQKGIVKVKKLVRRTGELYFVDADRENRCSIYVCIDYTALDWLSFIFCDAVDARRARKSIRLEACKPMAVYPNHRYFWRTKYWNINEDGYDEILMRLLAKKNPCSQRIQTGSESVFFI